ncbi:hypothetical protein ACLI4R_06700 [Natrialbaceae archaeon A-chndr2]
MRQLIATIVVALVLVLAGCGGADVTDDREPYGVDSETDPEPVPGLTTSGVTNASALQDAHFDALETMSFRYNATVVRADANGSVTFERTETHTIASLGSSATGETTSVEHTEAGADRTTLNWWLEDGTVHLHQHAGNETTAWTDESLEFTDLATTPDLEAAYDSIDTITESDGGDRYVLEGENVDIGAITNATVTVVVHAEGYVESYRLEGVSHNESVTIRITLEPIEGGELEEPAWLERAK